MLTLKWKNICISITKYTRFNLLHLISTKGLVFHGRESMVYKMKRYERNGNQREEEGPFQMRIVVALRFNLASHLRQHFKFATHLLLQPKKGKNHHR